MDDFANCVIECRRSLSHHGIAAVSHSNIADLLRFCLALLRIECAIAIKLDFCQLVHGVFYFFWDLISVDVIVIDKYAISRPLQRLRLCVL